MFSRCVLHTSAPLEFCYTCVKTGNIIWTNLLLITAGICFGFIYLHLYNNQQGCLASHWYCCRSANSRRAARKHLIIIVHCLFECWYITTGDYIWRQTVPVNYCSGQKTIYKCQMMCWDEWILFHDDCGCDWFGYEHMWAFLWQFPLEWPCRGQLTYVFSFCGQVGTTLIHM